MVEPLTEREDEVLTGLSEYLSNQEIANRLFLSPSTVKWYVRRLNHKLSTTNRDEIVARAQKLGLLEYDQRPVAPPRNNLPRQTTIFVGRDRELEEIAAILEMPDVRLLTILAPGGMGKTRIALEAVEQQLANFRDGVYFVALQPLSNPSDIVPVVADSIGYQIRGDDTEPKTQVMNYLENKQILLFTDSWEHLLDGVTIVNEMLQAAPDVKVLATSRERLNLSSETVYHLGGMRFPAQAALADALQTDAIQLLARTAGRVQPDFQISADNLDAVLQVCRLTAGMPLGIILAISWLDMLSLSEIVLELQHSVDFLRTEMRDVPDRHRSIRVIFEQSWSRLTSEEQEVFIGLSVFRGGFTRQTVRAVTGGGLQVFLALVNKAMVQTSGDDRYEVHDLLRQYAAEQLEARGRMDVTCQRHAEYYLEWLGDLLPDIKGRRQAGALREIEGDYANVRTAWQWATHHRDFDLIDQSKDTLTLFHFMRTRALEHESLFDLALAKLAPNPGEPPHPVWGKVLTRRWVSLPWQSPADLNTVRRDLDRGLEIANQSRDEFEAAFSILTQGQADHQAGEADRAFRQWCDCLERFRQIGDPYYVTWALHRIGFAHLVCGRLVEALAYTRLALDGAQTQGDTRTSAHCLFNIAGMRAYQGEYHQAIDCFEQALELAGELNSQWLKWNISGCLAYWRFCVGEFENARLLAESTRTEAKAYNFPDLSYIEATLVLDACLHEDYERAARFVETMKQYSTLKVGELVTLWVACITACGCGFYAEASRLLGSYLINPGIVGRGNMAETLPIAAILIAEAGKTRRAVELLALDFTLANAANVWTRSWLPLTRLRENLYAELGDSAFGAAWERGKKFDLEAIYRELQEEFQERP